MASDPIGPVRTSPIAPHQPPVVVDMAPSALDGAPFSFELPPAARFTSPAPTQSAALTFGPQFRYSSMSETAAVNVANTALAAARSSVASTGFVGNAHDFVAAQAFRDDLGKSHVRMDRTYDGVPIFGAQAIAHLDERGQIESMTGAPIPARLPIETKARVTPDAAKATAIAALGATPTQSGNAELVIVQGDDGEYRLAYHITATVEPANQTPRRTNSFVDAQNGQLLPLGFDEAGGFLDEDEIERTRTHLGSRATTGFSLRPQAAVGNIPAGHGNSIYSGVVPLATSRGNMNGYILRDPASGSETRDSQNAQGLFGAFGGFGGIFGRGSGAGQPISDTNNVWGEDSDPERQRAGIDAHFAAVSYLRYLREMFGRNSIDDRGARIISNVHVRRNLVNAYWDGSSVNYGDGDGRVSGPLVDLDIGGHEITHGLISNTSRLVYRGESGALNEAGADILGSAGLSWFVRGRRDQGIATDYMIGEAAFTPSLTGDALRYMDAPSRDRRNPTSEMYSRDHVSNMYSGEQDRGGVHINSGIPNHFFYLLANGGTNPTSGQRVAQGVGMEKALRIYYRANTVYFTPNTTFAQARAAWERAAEDLFGRDSAELRTVRAAAGAVGIESQGLSMGLVS